MKINGAFIFEIITYKNVLVEKSLTGLNFPEQVPVYHGFDYNKLIGIATLRKEGSKKIYADIMLFADIKGYPAIGYIKGANNIYCIAICGTPNKDKTIKPVL